MSLIRMFHAETSKNSLLDREEIVLHQFKAHRRKNKTEEKIQGAENGFAVLILG